MCLGLDGAASALHIYPLVTGLESKSSSSITPSVPRTTEYWKSGVFHFCIQDPDVEGLAARIVAAGGKQRMPVREYFPGEKPYRMVYMEDPLGNILEIYSHSYELTYSAGAYV